MIEVVKNLKGTEVVDSVNRIFSPKKDEIQSAYKTFSSAELDEIRAAMVGKLMINPVREVANRGGKGWRSMIMVLVCKAFGADPTELMRWTGIIELLHVGSLIIDDVQDQSITRRGGQSAHLIFGEPLAINAGCSAYFQFDRMVNDLDIDDKSKCKLYTLFFQCIRSAHAGQALDIGFDIDALVTAEDGNAAFPYTTHVKEVHRLKTGMAVVLCLCIGAIYANAKEEELMALVKYGEAIGVGFQIGDDVLNLNGFENNLKEINEDLMHGKLTYPVAIAAESLVKAERDRFLSTLVKDEKTIDDIEFLSNQLKQTNAIERSIADANKMVADAWDELEQHLVNNNAKTEMRRMGMFFVNRHY